MHYTSSTINSSVLIERSVFSQNSDSVFVEALCVLVHSSAFHGTIHSDALLFSNVLEKVIINGCNFSNNSGYSINHQGFKTPLPSMVIMYSQFSDNTDSAIHIRQCNITLLGNVVFTNNVLAGSDGAAIRAIDSKITLTGAVVFNGGEAHYGEAIYLENSCLSMSEASVQFDHNIAENGGAIYVTGDSNIQSKETVLSFIYNIAMSNGGAAYVDLYGLDSQESILLHYYRLLPNSSYCQNNTANLKDYNCAHFNISCDPYSTPSTSLKSALFSSLMCVVNVSDAVLIVNDTNQ